MSKFHVPKKKRKKKKKKCIENNMHVPLHDCMQKKKKCFISRVDFITISWMHATYSLASLGSLHNNKGESRENVT